MKYIQIGKHEHDPDKRDWYYDDYGNRLDKKTGELVVLCATIEEHSKPKPEAFVRVENEWLPKQMEFDFG